jgi:hypothetical protein
MVAGQVEPGEATIVLLGPGVGNNADEKSGAITVGNEQGSVDIDKDGWGVTVKQGQAPGKPFELTPAQLEGVLGGVASNATGNSQDGDGGEAGAESGDKTAQGKALEVEAEGFIAAAQAETSSFAAQQEFGSPSATTWESVRGVSNGTGQYVGSAPFYNLTTGNPNSLGTMTFVLDIDFANKTLGGGSSNITMPSPGPGGATTISQFSYASFTGNAVHDLDPQLAGNWAGTTLKLLDAGGLTAGAASIDVRWNTGIPPDFGGTVYGTR